MLNLPLALLVIFVLVCIVARLLHRYFLYIPDPKRVDPHEAGLTGVEEIVFKSAEGKKLIAWYRPAAKGKRTLLYFPGNSGNVAARAGKIKAIVADGYGVFIVNYRGFGGSASRPTEKRLVRDAVTAYDTLRGLGVPPRDIVLYGESLGTSVATQVCQQREAEGLVLESPFTSVVDVGKLAWPLLPLKQIMVDQYRTIDRIGSVDVPLFIIHGGRDAVIPLDMARRIFHGANDPKTLTVVPRTGHNDLFEQGAWARVRDFLAGLGAESVPAVEPQSAVRAGGPVEIPAAAATHH
jgi:fermentation-respiration switch protein FrsA (DUF1100 family)